MVTLGSLLLPVLLAAAICLVAGFVLWMVLPLHKQDFRPFADEAAVADAVRRQNLAPGQYIMPWCADPKQMNDPTIKAKYAQGPVGYLVLGRPGQPSIGRNLALTFLFHAVVAFFIAYIAAHTLPAGTPYLQVFRVTGAIAFLAQSAAVIPGGIWYGRPWGPIWREVVDGLVYALLTAGVFGWLWPR
jgi:FtsH-binding integral membrane protein